MHWAHSPGSTDTQESETVSLREAPYRTGTSPNWTGDRDPSHGSQRPFPTVSMSPVPLSQPDHHRFYPNSSGEENWTQQFDPLRTASPAQNESRQDLLWSMPPLAHIDESHIDGRNGAMLDDSLPHDTWSPWQSTDRNRSTYEVQNVNTDSFFDKTRLRTLYPTASLVPIARRKEHAAGFGTISASTENGAASMGHLFPTDNTNRHAHLRQEHCFNQRAPSSSLLTKFQTHAFDELAQTPYPSLWSSGSESGSESHTPEEIFAQIAYPEAEMGYPSENRYGGIDSMRG
jgi:hypothetical protein